MTSGNLAVVTRWQHEDAGVLSLPSGRKVRGRGLQDGMPRGADPEFGIYLLAKPPPALPWETRWVRWPDFRLPSDRHDVQDALRQAWCRSALERVEIACAGGRGRTGTALACFAVLDGVPAAEAVAYVRDRYNQRAVETPWQRWYVRRFAHVARAQSQ